MSTLTDLLHTTALAISGAATLYAATVTIVALTAVAAPTARRRRDARDTLKVLLHRSPRRG